MFFSNTQATPVHKPKTFREPPVRTKWQPEWDVIPFGEKCCHVTFNNEEWSARPCTEFCIDILTGMKNSKWEMTDAGKFFKPYCSKHLPMVIEKLTKNGLTAILKSQNKNPPWMEELATELFANMESQGTDQGNDVPSQPTSESEWIESTRPVPLVDQPVCNISQEDNLIKEGNEKYPDTWVPCEECWELFNQKGEEYMCKRCTLLETKWVQLQKDFLKDLPSKYPLPSEDNALDLMPKFLEDIFKEKRNSNRDEYSGPVIAHYFLGGMDWLATWYDPKTKIISWFASLNGCPRTDHDAEYWTVFLWELQQVSNPINIGGITWGVKVERETHWFPIGLSVDQWRNRLEPIATVPADWSLTVSWTLTQPISFAPAPVWIPLEIKTPDPLPDTEWKEKIIPPFNPDKVIEVSLSTWEVIHIDKAPDDSDINVGIKKEPYKFKDQPSELTNEYRLETLEANFETLTGSIKELTVIVALLADKIKEPVKRTRSKPVVNVAPEVPAEVPVHIPSKAHEETLAKATEMKALYPLIPTYTYSDIWCVTNCTEIVKVEVPKNNYIIIKWAQLANDNWIMASSWMLKDMWWSSPVMADAWSSYEDELAREYANVYKQLEEQNTGKTCVASRLITQLKNHVALKNIAQRHHLNQVMMKQQQADSDRIDKELDSSILEHEETIAKAIVKTARVEAVQAMKEKVHVARKEHAEPKVLSDLDVERLYWDDHDISLECPKDIHEIDIWLFDDDKFDELFQ